ncbi:MAG: hypothetical protein RR250_05805 [Akkermansia sp.]
MQDKTITDTKGHSLNVNSLFLWWAIWSVIGTTFVVVLSLSGCLPAWSHLLKEALHQGVFRMSEQAFVPAPLAMFCLGVSSTMFFTYVVLHVETLTCRLLILLGAAILMLLCIPVCAVWQIYANMIGVTLSVLLAGVGASITHLIWDRRRDAKSAIPTTSLDSDA